LGGAAQAQDWPSRSIRWIVPVSPGGATDVSARIVQGPVSKLLGQQVIVENKSGGSGIIATQAAVSAPPDGYTIALIYTSHAANPSMQKSLPYDSIRDITPVAFFWRAPLAISVHPDQPYRTLQDLIKAAKASPGEIPIASGGVGTGAHFASELFQRAAGIKLRHIPYKGAGPATADVIAGHTPVLASNASVPGGQVKPGQLRALAVSGSDRSPLLPDVPTIAELGYPGFESYEWIAFAGPAGMPKEATEKLNRAITEAIKQPEVAARFRDMGLEHVPMSPEAFKTYLISETEKLTEIIREAKITAD
jgi:tripartite-type tricarboxylate transporter receptor subunit TctC